MDGQDMRRRIGDPRRRLQLGAEIDALRRGQASPQGGSAADCLKAGRDPGRKFEALRRGSDEAGKPAATVSR